MSKPDPSETQEQPQARPPGRLRAAWACLRGRALVPEQIVWEWVEYQQRFNALLDKFNAALARDAKRLKALEEEQAPAQLAPNGGLSWDQRRQMKAELGSRVTGRKSG
jgi:hypothetical protein